MHSTINSELYSKDVFTFKDKLKFMKIESISSELEPNFVVKITKSKDNYEQLSN